MRKQGEHGEHDAAAPAQGKFKPLQFLRLDVLRDYFRVEFEVRVGPYACLFCSLAWVVASVLLLPCLCPLVRAADMCERPLVPPYWTLVWRVWAPARTQVSSRRLCV